MESTVKAASVSKKEGESAKRKAKVSQNLSPLHDSYVRQRDSEAGEIERAEERKGGG